MTRLAACLLLLLLLPPAEAQTARDKKKAARPKPAATATTVTPAKWPVESLAVEGNRNYTAAQILAVAALRIGQAAGKEEFEAARDRLMATGAFESVGYRFAPSAGGKGITAGFQVVEVAQVYPFRFERLDAPADQLTECLRRADPLFAENLPGTMPVLERYARALDVCPAAKNVGDKIVGNLVPDEEGNLVIAFRPATPPPAVAEVRFTGNKVIPATALQNAISGTAIGSRYTEQRFRQLLDAGIRPLYEARGRVRVAFPILQVEQAQSVEGVAVTVEVNEGEVYNLGQVRFAGEDLPESDLRKAAAFATGDIANFTEVQAALDRVRRQLRRKGYLNPDVGFTRDIHDDKKTVDLTVQIDKGPQYVFASLRIEGLDIHGEAAIRKLWAMKPGQPFDSAYPEYFLTRIKEDGVLDNLRSTKSSIQLDDKKLNAAVTLIFK